MFGRSPALLRRVLIALKTEKSIRGVVTSTRGGWLIVKNAELLEPRREVVTLDGDVLVRIEDVDFVQLLAGEG